MRFTGSILIGQVIFMRKCLSGSSLALMCFLFLACSSELTPSPSANRATQLTFGPEIGIGQNETNPSTPFLHYAPDGRLFAVWTQDHENPWPQGKQVPGQPHNMRGDRAPSPMRNAFIAASSDAGKTWSLPKRVNSDIEAVQGEENGPKVAFDTRSRAHVVWSIPGGKGDKTRANIRFALGDGKGGFTPARTLNEVRDTARFPVIEAMPDGNFLIAWIDRRIDNPKPRQLYLMKMGADGNVLTTNYQTGEGLCECCKLGFAFSDSGETVYLVDREVDAKKVRNHVLRKSTDGAATFAAPVEISNDGWQIPSCPHSGPSIGRDSRGRLHVSWFTLGRSENEAGIYYSVSKDDGKNFAPRHLVHANSAPETLYNNLIVGEDDTVYLAWTNLDTAGSAQVYMRSLAADGRTWGPIQQISQAKGDASRPALALRKKQLHVAWTETDGEDSRVVLRNAQVHR
jgi:hypothetical protein